MRAYFALLPGWKFAEAGGGFPGRQRVHEDAGAEFEAGEDCEAREQDESPIAFVVLDPGIERHRALEGVEPPNEAGEQAQRGTEQPAVESFGVSLHRCDHRLVGEATGPRARCGQALLLEEWVASRACVRRRRLR